MAKAATKPPTFAVTGLVRLSYAHLFEATRMKNKSGQEEGEPKFRTTILIPKNEDGEKTKARLEKAIEAAKAQGKDEKWGGRIPKNLKLPLHDGDEDADLEKNPEYAGHYYMNVSNTRRPQVVDADLNPITERDEVYSGCWGRISLNMFAYDNQSKGVSASLNNFQKLKDDQPFEGMGTEAEDDFAEPYDSGDSLLG